MAWDGSGMGRSYDYEVMYSVMFYQLLQTISTLGVESSIRNTCRYDSLTSPEGR
jgi:hypothetical protein